MDCGCGSLRQDLQRVFEELKLQAAATSESSVRATMSASVVTSRLGPKAVSVVLKRPAALNALDLPMIRALADLVVQWRAADDVAVAVFSGDGDRAFCAGGDVKSLHDARVPGGVHEHQSSFFREEYDIDHALAELPDHGVQQVVLYDGVTMGGGVGVSIHAPFRIATEATMFAMPETAIGFFPDVGGSWFLPRLPGAMGMYLALTGARVKGSDAVVTGLATHYVPRDRLPALVDALGGVSAGDAEEVGGVVSAFAQDVDAAASSFAALSPTIDRTFNQESYAAIVAALEAEAAAGDGFATKTLETLSRMSPTSLAVTFRQLQLGAELPSLRACLDMEVHMAERFMQGDDFYAGVKSVLFKGDPPVWQPAPTPEDVATYFPADMSSL